MVGRRSPTVAAGAGLAQTVTREPRGPRRLQGPAQFNDPLPAELRHSTR